jgi:hypothetical protein
LVLLLLFACRPRLRGPQPTRGLSMYSVTHEVTHPATSHGPQHTYCFWMIPMFSSPGLYTLWLGMTGYVYLESCFKLLMRPHTLSGAPLQCNDDQEESCGGSSTYTSSHPTKILSNDMHAY